VQRQPIRQRLVDLRGTTPLEDQIGTILVKAAIVQRRRDLAAEAIENRLLVGEQRVARGAFQDERAHRRGQAGRDHVEQFGGR